MLDHDIEDFSWRMLGSAVLDFVGVLFALAGTIALMLVFAALVGKL